MPRGRGTVEARPPTTPVQALPEEWRAPRRVGRTPLRTNCADTHRSLTRILTPDPRGHLKRPSGVRLTGRTIRDFVCTDNSDIILDSGPKDQGTPSGSPDCRRRKRVTSADSLGVTTAEDLGQDFGSELRGEGES